MSEITKDVVKETIVNAKELLEEAEILFEKGKYPRTYVLAVLSAEEFSKAFLYRAVLAGIINYERISKDLLNHDKKLYHEIHVISGMYAYLVMRDRLLESLEHDKGKPHSEHEFLNEMSHGLYHVLLDEKHPLHKEFTRILDSLKGAHQKKKKALYVEINDHIISRPKDAVTQEEAKYLIELLNNQSPHFSTIIDFDDERFAKMVVWLHPELFREERKPELSIPY